MGHIPSIELPDVSEVIAMLGARTIERMDLPLAEATGLPNLAYTSEAWQRLESRRLFARSWSFAGYARDLARPGDAVPVDLAGMPIMLVRGGDGEIRAFHNVCRHRGATILAEPAHGLKFLTCPYHAWAYDLKGRLRTRPHFHGGDRHDVIKDGAEGPGLIPIATAVWHHWVFVNIDGEAGPFDDFIAPIARRCAGYDFSAAGYAGSLSFDVACNWKLALENYIEPYHVFAAHPRLHSFVSMAEREPSKCDGHVMWNFYQFRAPEEGRGVGLPYFPNLGDDLMQRGMWFVAVPNFAFEIYPDHIATFIATPVAPDRARERIDIYLVGEAAAGSQYAEQRQAVFDMWRDLNGEDLDVIARLQRGRLSPGYDGGRFSPYWDEAPLHLSRQIVKAML
jgi:phenylpropionate dioxygenase-like ring-hydroxylating dioxygenase large terminal subunit